MKIVFLIILFLINLLLNSCQSSPVKEYQSEQKKSEIGHTKRVRAKHWYMSSNGSFSFVVNHIEVIEVDSLIKVGDTVLKSVGSGLSSEMWYYIIQP